VGHALLKLQGEGYHGQPVHSVPTVGAAGRRNGTTVPEPTLEHRRLDVMAKMAKKLSAAKAKVMLKEGRANGRPLTKAQRGYFGAVAGGNARKGRRK